MQSKLGLIDTLARNMMVKFNKYINVHLKLDCYADFYWGNSNL